MRFALLVIGVAGFAAAQTMTEVGATAAGSAIGSAAGKKVSDGITAIFGKVEKSTAKAAKPAEEKAPLIEVGPATAKQRQTDSVPPPPPIATPHRAPAPKPAEPVVEAAPVPPPPPPPQMTADDLKKVAAGMPREELLKFGAPASRITMFDEGHLLEVFSYTTKDASLGRVRLTDGSVSSVELR